MFGKDGGRCRRGDGGADAVAAVEDLVLEGEELGG
jgi:hypothetical protein